MPRNRKIPMPDADDELPPLPNSPTDNSPSPESPADIAAMEISNVSDHIVHIDSLPGLKAIEVSRPIGIFGKPMGLKPDPDKKRKWKQFDSTDRTNLRRVIRHVFKGFVPPWRSLLAVFLWSLIAMGLSLAASLRWPAQKVNMCPFLCNPLGLKVEVVAYLGVALFVFMGFHVYQAYSQYQHALEVWRELISGTICSFATLSGRIFPDGMLHEGDRKRLFSFLIAFPVTLKRRLRGERDIAELASVLSQTDIEKLQVANNMPRYCLEVLNTYIIKYSFEAEKNQEKFPQHFIDRLMGYLRLLSLSMNKSERIREYNVNRGYLVHLRVFIVLWLILLPFSLIQDCGWTTIILSPFIAYGILGIEQVSIELSEPFGYSYNDVPIGQICNNITTGVRSKYILASRPVDSILYPADTPDPNDFLEVPLREYALVT